MKIIPAILATLLTLAMPSAGAIAGDIRCIDEVQKLAEEIYQPKHTDFPLIWKDMIKKAGIKITGKSPTNIWEFLKIDPAQYERILIFSLVPHLGDAIIAEHSQFSYLHRQFPDAQIVYISPTASTFHPTNWLKTVPIDLEKLFSPKTILQIEGSKELSIFSREIEQILIPHLGPKTLILWRNENILNLSSIVRGHASKVVEHKPWRQNGPNPYDSRINRIADQMNENLDAFRKFQLPEIILKSGAHGIKTESLVLSVFGVPQIQLPKYLQKYFKEGVSTIDLDEYAPNKLLLYDERTSLGVMKNIYQQWSFLHSVYYGQNFTFEHPQELYAPPHLSAAAQDFIEMSFAQPERPFVVINLNTMGGYKADALVKSYVARIKNFVNQIERRFPELNIFVSRPEDHFTARVVNQVDAFIIRQTKRSKRVAYLPTDGKKLWGNILTRARAIITEDSGFAHVAGVVNPRMITLSPVGYAEMWHRPGTDWGKSYENGRLDLDAIAWLEKEMAPGRPLNPRN